jgi:hypothetical protein
MYQNDQNYWQYNLIKRYFINGFAEIVALISEKFVDLRYNLDHKKILYRADQIYCCMRLLGGSCQSFPLTLYHADGED